MNGVTLSLLEGGSGIYPLLQIRVELAHQVSGKRVIDGPKRRDNAFRSREQKRSDQARIIEGTLKDRASGIAPRENHQSRPKPQVGYLSCLEESVLRRAWTIRQDQTGPIRMFRIHGDMNRDVQNLIGVERLGLNPLLGCTATARNPW